MLYRMALFLVTLSDPNYPKPPRSRHFASLFISSRWVEIRTPNLAGLLIVASPSPRIQERGVVKSRESFVLVGNQLYPCNV